MSNLDILEQLSSVDLSTVKTSLPILANGVVSATITKIAPGTDDKQNKFVIVNYALASAHVDIDGKAVNPGFPLVERIYLNNWTDPQTQEVKNLGIVRLAQLREAIFGKAEPGTKLNLNELVNQTVTLQLRYEPNPTNKKTGEVYGPQTAITRYVKAKK